MKIRAKKSLGQHFLNSKSVLEKIVFSAQIKEGDNILEIGPGTGILTSVLLNAGAKVVAVEKDDRAVQFLRQEFAADISTGKLNLLHGDILEMNLSEAVPNNASFSIVANIPYYITGAILEKFLQFGPRPSRMVLLVQKEVAERIVARNGKESILSVSVKAFGEPHFVLKVPPGAFTPPPSVDSAVLVIENISGNFFETNKLDPEFFFKVIHAAFAHKRKLATRNLEIVSTSEKVSEVWHKLDLDAKIRAEDVSVEKWLHIALLLK